jgi:hypothetical protein
VLETNCVTSCRCSKPGVAGRRGRRQSLDGRLVVPRVIADRTAGSIASAPYQNSLYARSAEHFGSGARGLAVSQIHSAAAMLSSTRHRCALARSRAIDRRAMPTSATALRSASIWRGLGRTIGRRAKRHTSVIDVERRGS